MNINDQLNIGVAPSPLTPTRYTRGLRTAQPQLGTEDWSLDFYNDTRSLNNYHNMNGWENSEGDRDLGSEKDAGLETWNNAIGFYGIAYPPCLPNTKCQYCKTKCQGEGKKWLRGGKACYNGCVATYIAEKKESKGKYTPAPTGGGEAPDVPSTPSGGGGSTPTANGGLSTGAKIGIGVGALAVIGLVAYLALRKK